MIQIVWDCLTFCFLGLSTYLNLKAEKNENILGRVLWLPWMHQRHQTRHR